MNPMMILEYHEESGIFHYNLIINNTPSSVLGKFGWEPIATTVWEKGNLFCQIMNLKLYRRMRNDEKPLSLDEVKEEWRYFCFVFNSTLKNVLYSENKEFLAFKDMAKDFDSTTGLVNLGCPNLSDYWEDWDEEPNPIDYDPLSFTESNTFRRI